MNKKRLIISLIWFVLMLGLPIIFAFKLKFPAFDEGRYGHIIIPLLVILPLISLLYSITVYNKQNDNKIIDAFIVVGLITGILYSLICTFGFRMPSTLFYPLTSTTTDIENYLIIEDNLAESEYEYINRVFPEKIPDNATDVEYYYHCNWIWDYRIEVKWRLPREEYLADKEKTLSLFGGNSTVENGNSSFNYIFDMYGYTAKKEFDDNECLISYVFVSKSLN